MGDPIREALEKVTDRLESLVASMSLPLPPALHMEGLRGTLPDIAAAARAALALPTEDSPTHRCKVCGALWWGDPTVTPRLRTWSLRSERCGPCCDNVAMGDQIEALPTEEGRMEKARGIIWRWLREEGRQNSCPNERPCRSKYQTECIHDDARAFLEGK